MLKVFDRMSTEFGFHVVNASRSVRSVASDLRRAVGKLDGTLEQAEAPDWDPRPAVCVVACSGGYPGDYARKLPIHGLGSVASGPDLQVFHAGTVRKGKDLLTNGGRVLSVCALGDTVSAARERAYQALEQIEFTGMHFRSDIGLRP
jgi:phosphoribosylamine--glycine ligase